VAIFAIAMLAWMQTASASFFSDVSRAVNKAANDVAQTIGGGGHVTGDPPIGSPRIPLCVDGKKPPCVNPKHDFFHLFR